MSDATTHATLKHPGCCVRAIAVACSCPRAGCVRPDSIRLSFAVENGAAQRGCKWLPEMRRRILSAMSRRILCGRGFSPPAKNGIFSGALCLILETCSFFDGWRPAKNAAKNATKNLAKNVAEDGRVPRVRPAQRPRWSPRARQWQIRVRRRRRAQFHCSHSHACASDSRLHSRRTQF